MDEKKSKMDDKNESIKRKNEVIDILEKENKRLQNDLGQERNHNEKIIEMIEANEKGITDLNNVIRNLKNELQKAKEIQAKMSNEKLRDNQTILKLNESKTIYEEKINVLKDQIENYKIYVTKIGNELDQYKKLSSLLQETVKVNEIVRYFISNNNVWSKLLQRISLNIIKTVVKYYILSVSCLSHYRRHTL